MPIERVQIEKEWKKQVDNWLRSTRGLFGVDPGKTGLREGKTTSDTQSDRSTLTHPGTLKIHMFGEVFFDFNLACIFQVPFLKMRDDRRKGF